jgi:inorganic triphosphatase YgiF
MEIEAKFVVLAESTEEHLLTTDTLGTYDLMPAEPHDLHDAYLDTSDYRLLAAGYAYRRRIDGDRTYLTLKGLGNVQDGAIHQREEIEVIVPHHAACPTGPLAERLHALDIEGPLSSLFELQQQRFARPVWDHGRQVGLLSIDRIQFTGRQRTIPFTELEFELGEGGEETDLQRVIEALRAQEGLSPEPTSKFLRGLVLAVGCQALRAAGVYALWANTAPDVIRAVKTVAETWRDKVGQIRYNHTDEEP